MPKVDNDPNDEEGNHYFPIRMVKEGARGFDLRCDFESERFPDGPFDMSKKTIAFLQLAPFDCESDMVQGYGRLCRMGDIGHYYKPDDVAGHIDDHDREYSR